MHELTDELIRYHSAKASVLTEIQSLFPSVAKGSAAARNDLAALFSSFRNDNEKAHHHNEELILHELVKTEIPIHARIERTAEEHVTFGRLVQRLLTDISRPVDEPAVIVSKVEWFLSQYDDHASNEEAILFPAANRELSSNAWSRVREKWIEMT